MHGHRVSAAVREVSPPAERRSAKIVPALRILHRPHLASTLTALAVAGGCVLVAPPAPSSGRPLSETWRRASTAAVEPGGSGPAGGSAPGEGAPATPAPNPCSEPALGLRCPDLTMSAPSQLHLDRGTMPGHLLLRATSSVNNRGRGPLELRARRLGVHRWAVYQAVYDDRGRPHLVLTRVQLVFKFVPGDRYGYGYVAPASYWKVQNVASFELWSVSAQLAPQALVRAGPKVDYCLRDLFRTAPAARSPRERVYPGCSREAGITRDVLGTSVGWSDVYPYGYPQQWIDVTGLRGTFAFVMRADPDGLFLESDHANDASETFVELPSGRVLGHRVGLASP
jgi:hypothetical protein